MSAGKGSTCRCGLGCCSGFRLVSVCTVHVCSARVCCQQLGLGARLRALLSDALTRCDVRRAAVAAGVQVGKVRLNCHRLIASVEPGDEFIHIRQFSLHKKIVPWAAQ